jgi:hypothetical protein
VAETTVKRLLCCVSDGKAMGQVYQCRWRICREINVLVQVRISQVLRFISICGLFTDSPSHIMTCLKVTVVHCSISGSQGGYYKVGCNAVLRDNVRFGGTYCLHPQDRRVGKATRRKQAS